MENFLNSPELRIKKLNHGKVSIVYNDYVSRIKKTLYCGTASLNLPSLPLTGLLVDKYSATCQQRCLEKLDLQDASHLCFEACVTPCSTIVALIYLDKLRNINSDYLANTSPSQVFLISLEWRLYFEWTDFFGMLAIIEGELARREGFKRGFYTYSDVTSVSKFLPFSYMALIQMVSQVVAICSVGYSAAIGCMIVAPIITKNLELLVASSLLDLENQMTAILKNDIQTKFMNSMASLILLVASCANNKADSAPVDSELHASNNLPSNMSEILEFGNKSEMNSNWCEDPCSNEDSVSAGFMLHSDHSCYTQLPHSSDEKWLMWKNMVHLKWIFHTFTYEILAHNRVDEIISFCESKKCNPLQKYNKFRKFYSENSSINNRNVNMVLVS